MSDCVTCGKDAGIFKNSGRMRTYCGPLCSPEIARPKVRVAPHVNCAHCGKRFKSKWSVESGQCAKYCSRVCALASRAVQPRPCAGCGASFKPKPSGKNKGLYCSRECAYKDIAAWKTTTQPAPRSNLNPCGCGALIWSRKKRCAACESRRAAGEALRKFIRSIKARFCGVCRDDYPHVVGKRFCSEACSDEAARRVAAAALEAKKRNRRTRKALERGASRAITVDPIAVFHRDGWKCRACGCATPQSLRGRHNDDSPELDHIVPVSAGGAHDMDNLQTLCRVCNILKGAAPMQAFVERYFRA